MHVYVHACTYLHIYMRIFSTGGQLVCIESFQWTPPSKGNNHANAQTLRQTISWHLTCQWKLHSYPYLSMKKYIGYIVTKCTMEPGIYQVIFATGSIITNPKMVPAQTEKNNHTCIWPGQLCLQLTDCWGSCYEDYHKCYYSSPCSEPQAGSWIQALYQHDQDRSHLKLK